jgi:uncharacterized protein
MQSIDLELSQPDLAALDEFLMSERAPPDSMGISDLDGFLTAIAIGPELVMPSEWLPVIWGGEEPEFADDAEIQAVLGAILARFNEILRGLDQDPPVCEPIFWETPEGIEIAGDWAEGFVDGVRLRIDAWEPIFTDHSVNEMMLPILALCSDPDGESLLGIDGEAEEFLAAAVPDAIPACVVEIHRFWKDRRSSKMSRRVGPKVGRNEPCPCGSGRKFKRCCAIG